MGRLVKYDWGEGITQASHHPLGLTMDFLSLTWMSGLKTYETVHNVSWILNAVEALQEVVVFESCIPLTSSTFIQTNLRSWGEIPLSGNWQGAD